jgi:REP element-mobilizing transposase RayT
MSRPLRIEHDNACYHVTARGDRRSTIFRTDSDRLTWLAMLAETCERFAFSVLAYCLMGNHYHLVVQTRQGQLSRGMRYLNSNYSQYFNRQHGLVAWLSRDSALAQFGSEEAAAIREFASFVLEGIGQESPFRAVRHQLFLGDEDFCERAARGEVKSALLEINRSQRRAVVLPLAAYFDDCPERNQAMAKAYLSHCYTMMEIAEFCQVSVRTVSRAVHAFRKMSDCQT